MKQLYLIRGLPGSGKSTLAQNLFHYWIENDICQLDVCWVETDDWFLDGHGNYVFDPKQIGQADDHCQKRAFAAMQGTEIIPPCPVIIVSNTFTQNWEMKPYVQAAQAHGYQVQILHCEGAFENTHAVPPTSIAKMNQRWERYNRLYCEE